MLASKKVVIFCAAAAGLAIAAACGDAPAPKPAERVGTTSSDLLASAWSITGPLNVARQNHVAALLQSGLVLVAGGHPGNNTPTATAETFNPSTQVWRSVASMSTARRLFGACSLASGKVLVAGGNAGLGDVTSAELYDPVANTWTATGSLAAAREDFSMTCLSDGRVLVAGGSGPSGLLSSAEVYNPTSGTWSSAGTLPAAVHTQGAVLLGDGRVLIAGGNGSLGSVGTAAIWTPSTNAWTATGSMATPRSFYALNLLSNGRVLAAGGLVNAIGTATNKAEIYNPSTGTWSAAANLNTARYSGASVTLAAGPMVIGGINGGSPLNTSESYDSVHNTWTQVATVYGAVNQTATALTSTAVIVTGGNTGQNATTSAQIYGLLNVFALYAQRSVTLGSNDHVIGGDVGVATVASTGSGAQLVVGASATVQTTHNVVAPSVSLGSGAAVGDVQTNSLANSGATLGALAPYPASMPTLPLAPAPGSGGADVNVPSLTITTLGPGNYGALNVTGTAYLNAGSYTFATVTIADQGHLAGVSGTAIVTVTGTFHAGNSVSISSPGGTPAGQLAITAAGYDSGPTPAFAVGTGAAISALLAAPHGTLSLGDSTLATGAFAGFDVKLGAGVTITHQSGFYAVQPSGQPVAGYSLPPTGAPVIGPVPSNMPIGLAVILPMQNQADLQNFIAAVTDPTNSQYRSYKSISDFATKYGDSPTEVAKVGPWAATYGLTATTYANNLAVDIQGTAAQIEQLLHANLLLALRPDGSIFYEPDRSPMPSVPTSVDAIQMMDNYVAPKGAQTFVAGVGFDFESSDLRTAYLGTGTSCSTLTGVGQSIGLVEFDAYTQPGTPGPGGVPATDDITSYLNLTGLTSCAAVGGAQPCVPAPILRTVNAPPAYPPNGANPGPAQPSGNTGSTEAALDVEMAIAMAPGAQIVNVEGTSIDSVLSALATTPNLNQISDSWNARSSTSQRFIDEFAAQGQSFFVASGDAGQYDASAQPCPCACTNAAGVATTETLFVCNGSCQSTCPSPDAGTDGGLPALQCQTSFSPVLDGQLTDMRASTNITLVGGTSLTTCTNTNSGSCAGAAQFTQSYQSESAWPQSGGGVIPGTALPDFQKNVTTLASTAGRNSPDVAMPAVNVLAVATGCGPIIGADGGTIPGTLVNGRCPVANLQPGTPSSAAGTSAAAPLWAGYMALINQAGASQTPPLHSVGFPNEAFYQLLTGPGGSYPQAFHDITGGGPTSNSCSLGPTPATGWDQSTGLGSPNGCSLIAVVDSLASPPQATVELTNLQFGTTGFNICSGCNCASQLPDTTITCSPQVAADGGATPATVNQEVGCSNGHGALVTVTCTPNAKPVDGGNGTASIGIDTTVTISLENNCGSHVEDNPKTFTAANVLPGEPQSGASGLSCDSFGSNCLDNNLCDFNSFSADVKVSNTGGYFTH